MEAIPSNPFHTGQVTQEILSSGDHRSGQALFSCLERPAARHVLTEHKCEGFRKENSGTLVHPQLTVPEGFPAGLRVTSCTVGAVFYLLNVLRGIYSA